MKSGTKSKRIKYADLDEDLRPVFATPAGFAKHALKMTLTPKQEAVLSDFGLNRSRVSVLCCNEAGKTTRMITALILWHLAVFRRLGENGGVITTSGSWSQIVNQLVPALKSHAHRFPKWDFLDREIKVDGIPNWMAFSTREPGRAEGFHGSPEHPLLAVVDEAKSVRDVIFRVIEDRCRPQRTGYFSSPGYSIGEFYASHGANAAHYVRHLMTVDDCPWIDRPEMRRLIEKAGAGDYEKGLLDPVVQSAFFGKFMPFTENALLSLVDIEECLNDPPEGRPGARHAWCDFAAGGDENVLAMRVGNRVWIHDAWRDKNTMGAVGRFITGFSGLKLQHGLQPEEIEGDADGMGRPIVDRIREAGWNILDFHANAAAFDPTRFKNRSSETWFLGAEAIQQRKFVIPDDAQMKAQMIDRKGRYESSGRRWIESKDDLFRRQSKDTRPKRSPDRADAVFGAMAQLPILTGVNVVGPERAAGPWANDPDMGQLEEHMSIPEELLRGFDAG